MTDIQLIITALREEAANCGKSANHPHQSGTAKEAFWWQKQHLEALARTLEKVQKEASEQP